MPVHSFGSLNLDYVYSVDHFVQGGETMAALGRQVFAGGKGLNQSIAMSRAGAEVYHAGAVGEDGRFLLELLESAGVNTEYIQVLSDVRTGNAIIQNDVQGDNCILLYSGANRAVTREMADEVLKHFDQGDWLVLQNEISEIPYIVRKAHEKGMKIILNPSPMDEKIFQIPLDDIDCLILNEVEALGLISNADCDNQEPDGNAIMVYLYDSDGEALYYDRAKEDGVPKTISTDQLSPDTTYYVCLTPAYGGVSMDYSLLIKNPDETSTAYKTAGTLSEAVGSTITEDGTVVVPGTNRPMRFSSHGSECDGDSAGLRQFMVCIHHRESGKILPIKFHLQIRWPVPTT